MDPTEGGGASTDLQKRFKTVLEGLAGREVGTDALFDVLKLEVLDWRLDQGVGDAELKNAADRSSIKVPPEEEEAAS